MTKHGSDFDKFDSAMDTILKANPAAVKAAMEADMKTNAAERRVKGEHKRGRKKTKERK